MQVEECREQQADDSDLVTSENITMEEATLEHSIETPYMESEVEPSIDPLLLHNERNTAFASSSALIDSPSPSNKRDKMLKELPASDKVSASPSIVKSPLLELLEAVDDKDRAHAPKQENRPIQTEAGSNLALSPWCLLSTTANDLLLLDHFKKKAAAQQQTNQDFFMHLLLSQTLANAWPPQFFSANNFALSQRVVIAKEDCDDEIIDVITV